MNRPCADHSKNTKADTDSDRLHTGRPESTYFHEFDQPLEFSGRCALLSRHHLGLRNMSKYSDLGAAISSI